MAQPMPESVKTARVGINGPVNVLSGFKFEVNIAPDEVMILLAIDYWYNYVSAVGANEIQHALWRKSETDAPNTIFDAGGSPDMLFSRIDKVIQIAESLKTADKEFISLPWPLILIRPPRLMCRTVAVTAFTLEWRLWYLLRKVNDVDLARLMVKDHA